MDNRLKQRLVGAVVLVSLAVIFLPMLLTGGGEVSTAIRGTNVPPAPDYAFQDPAVPGPSTSEPESVVVAGEPSSEAMGSASEPEVPEPAAPSAPATGAPVAAPPSAAPAAVGGWVVQVGSFSSPGNAHTLRDKLRAKGYASFVQVTGIKEGKPAYRVQVGPELSRELAVAMQARLTADMQLAGIVLTYP